MGTIVLKSARELKLMRQAGRIAACALHEAGRAVEPGVSTAELDRIVRRCIERMGATPSFLHYNGFPAAACISVNEEVIHGIPGHRILKPGDLVSIDVGACIAGFHGDTAWTFACGAVTEAAQRLMDTTREALFEGIAHACAGNRVGDVSNAVQRYVEARGYSVVRQFVGHGVGASVHEAPEVPNFGEAGRGARLLPGTTIAIEPMVTAGGHEVLVQPDGWTAVTADKSLSAHYEHSIAVTAEGPVILTLPEA